MNKDEYNVVPVAFDPATGFHFNGLDEMFRVANCYLQSGLAPESFRTAQQLIICWATGAELGLKPLQAMKVLVVINNRITIMGDGALGLCRRSGLLEEEPEVEYSGQGETRACTVTVKRKGSKKARSASFSLREAKTAGLLDKGTGKPGIPPWKAYPDRMLYYRPLGFVLRDTFSDILLGIPIAEEMIDVPADEDLDADKVAGTRGYTQEVAAKGTEVIGAEQQLPSAAETVEPAFEEDKTQTHMPPFAEQLAKDYPQPGAPVGFATPPAQPASPLPADEQIPAAEEQGPDDLSFTVPIQPKPKPEPVPAQPAPEQRPAWMDHVIKSIPHVRFFGRRISELEPKDLARIENQWIPQVKPKLADASDEQRQELPLFEEAIAYNKSRKLF